jgi:hypothetical protein
MKDILHRLICGEQPFVLVGLDEMPAEPLLLSGSFNPLHRGHEELLRAAEQLSGRRGMLELSVINVDKPPLDETEVERRLQQLKDRHAAVLTCAPTFAAKAELFPGAWFALGYDTAIRLLSPDYHADIPAMLQRFRELKTRFAVAGRLHDGTFRQFEDLEMPADCKDLFIPIPDALFRQDISSTELRRHKP